MARKRRCVAQVGSVRSPKVASRGESWRDGASSGSAPFFAGLFIRWLLRGADLINFVVLASRSVFSGRRQEPRKMEVLDSCIREDYDLIRRALTPPPDLPALSAGKDGN